MRIVAETTILKRKYEQEVALRPDFGFFDQVWVQDALHVHWAYLQDAHGNVLLRLPFSKKLGVTAYLQPLFMRELKLLHEDQNKDVLRFLQRKGLLHLNLAGSEPDASYKGMYQVLKWEQGIDAIRSAYSANIKRVLKKATNLQLETISYQAFQEFFTAQKGENLGNLNAAAWQRLSHLFALAQEKDAATCYGAFEQGSLVAVALFFNWNNKLYFMKGTLNAAGKDIGALVFILDAVLEKSAATHHTLDFIGSNQTSIAQFYRKFGAKDAYYQVVKGCLPFV
jgi:hypothetical protein